MVAEHVEKMQERDEKMRDKLSPGAYIAKQVRSILIDLVTVGGGAAAGHYIGKALNKPHWNIPESISSRIGGVNKLPAWGVGLGVGLVIDGLIQGYEMWSKGEAAKLAIDEVSRDVSEARLRMNPELVRENQELREIVAKQDAELKAGGRPSHSVSTKDAVLEASDHAQGISQQQVG